MKLTSSRMQKPPGSTATASPSPSASWYSAAAEHNPNSRYFFRRNSIAAASTATSNTDVDQPSSDPAAEGLNDAALLGFPKLFYSQAKSHEEGGGDLCAAASGCSICLQDYKDTDMLRLLPDCRHFFLLKCVTPWLKLQPTCPICRNSQLRSPQENAAAAVVLEMVPPSNR